jgi:probable rRNA maturation factor
MKKPTAVARPELFLAVQYAAHAPELPRWRLRRWVRRAIDEVAAEGAPFSSVALTLRLVDADEGRQLNNEFRQRDYATNVLTFEYGVDPFGAATGDVVLCLPVLRQEARDQGKPLLNHAAHLTIHGVLHALGYDHTEAQQAEVMESLETRILRKMGIDDPYQA